MNLSSRAKLIAPGIVACGTLSITTAELYFEVDEDDAEFLKQDPEVGKTIKPFIYPYISLLFTHASYHTNLSGTFIT